MIEQVATDLVVLMHYTLRNDAGEVLDTSRDDKPMPYLHGHGNIVPGLEEALDGKTTGDKIKVIVSPEKGYGVRSETKPQPIPREAFPQDAELEEGMHFMTQTDEGALISLWVVGSDDKNVFVDINHPLSGERLHFEVDIIRLRAATQEEIEHGHPHGPDGTSGHDQH